MARFSDEQISAILLGPAKVSRVAFPLAPPESGIEVGVRVLTDQEIDAACVQAQEYFGDLCDKKQLSLKGFVDIDPDQLEREKQRQMIAVAFVDPDDPTKPFFAHPVQIRRLSSVVVQRLWDLYMDHLDAVNPYRNLDVEQVKELADALKKEPNSQALLADFARDTLCSLVRTLAVLPPN